MKDYESPSGFTRHPFLPHWIQHQTVSCVATCCNMLQRPTVFAFGMLSGCVLISNEFERGTWADLSEDDSVVPAQWPNGQSPWSDEHGLSTVQLSHCLHTSVATLQKWFQTMTMPRESRKMRYILKMKKCMSSCWARSVWQSFWPLHLLSVRVKLVWKTSDKCFEWFRMCFYYTCQATCPLLWEDTTAQLLLLSGSRLHDGVWTDLTGFSWYAASQTCQRQYWSISNIKHPVADFWLHLSWFFQCFEGEGAATSSTCYLSRSFHGTSSIS